MWKTIFKGLEINMNKKFPLEIVDLLKRTDHTLLNPAAKIDDIINICKESIEFSVASACIPPCYVAKMKNLFKRKSYNLHSNRFSKWLLYI